MATSYRVLLDGVSDVNGVVQNPAFNYTGNIAVEGRVRKSSTAPLYKMAALSGTVTASGLALKVFMKSDD